MTISPSTKTRLVDPVLVGRESGTGSRKIQAIGAPIESVDVAGTLGGPADLVVSQHTLEHVLDPVGILKGLFRATSDETIFAMEVPCFDVLVDNLRFDQVFHQHVHYYSVDSFNALVRAAGGEMLRHTFNYGYWGALIAVFRKARRGRAPGKQPRMVPPVSLGAIRERLELFRNQMGAAAEVMGTEPRNKLFGYGAALMLPTLGYHLGTDFRGFSAILDDDPAKNGLGYANLAVKVRRPQGIDLGGSTVVLTALDNRRPILRRLADLKPKRIINPLACI